MNSNSSIFFNTNIKENKIYKYNRNSTKSIIRDPMKPYITILFLFFCVQSKFLFAQQNLSKEKVEALNELSKKIEGTYQVQIINSRELAAFELQLMEIIENKREENDTIYYPVKPNIRVMILPKKVIENPEFKKIEMTKRISE